MTDSSDYSEDADTSMEELLEMEEELEEETIAEDTEAGIQSAYYSAVKSVIQNYPD